jgi:hypothetical protein
MGIYWPALPPIYQKKSNETNKRMMADYMDIMKEELFRQTIRQRTGNSLICMDRAKNKKRNFSYNIILWLVFC